MDANARAKEIAAQVSSETALPGEALDVLLAAAAIVFRNMQREGATTQVEFADGLFESQAAVFLASTPR